MTDDPNDKNRSKTNSENKKLESTSPLIEKIGTITSLILLCAAIILRILGKNDRPFFTDAAGYNVFVSSLFVAALGFYLVSKLASPEVKIPLNKPIVLLIAFFGWVGISCLLSTYPFASWYAFGIWMGHLAGVLFILLLGTNDKHLLPVPISATLSSVLTVVLYGWYERLLLYPELQQKVKKNPELMEGIVSPEMYREFMSRLTGNQPSGSFLNPNSFGAIACIGMILIGGLCIHYTLKNNKEQSNLLEKILPGLSLVISGMLLFPLFIWTDSKGVTISFAGALIAGLLLGLKHRIKKLWPYLVGSLIGVAALGTFFAYSAGWLGVEDSDSSLGFRLGYWHASGEIIRNHPVSGVGLYNYQLHYSRHKPDCAGETRRSHNDYLDLAAETGVPGLLLFLLFWGFLLYSLLKSPENTSTPVENKTGIPDNTGNRNLFLLLGTGVFSIFILIGLQIAPTFSESDTTIMQFAMICFWGISTVVLYKSFAGKIHSYLSFPSNRWILGAAIAFYLIHALVDFDLYVPGVAWSVWLVTGLLIVSIQNKNGTVYTWKEPGLKGQWISLLLLLLVAGSLYNGSSYFNSSIRWKSLKSTASGKNPEEIMSGYQNLLSERPTDIVLQVEYSEYIHSRYCKHPSQLIESTTKTSSRQKYFKKWFSICLYHLKQARDQFDSYWSLYYKQYKHIMNHRNILKEEFDTLPSVKNSSIPHRTYSLQQAYRSLKKAANLYSSNANLLFELGMMELQFDHREKARNLFERALDIHKCQETVRLQLKPENVRTIKNFLNKQ